MDQNLWGKYGWYTYHVLTTLLPPIQHTEDHYALVHLTTEILPCSLCRKSFQHNLAAVQPAYLDPKATEMRKAGFGLNRAWFDVHNIVNQKLGKQVYPWETFLRDMELQHLTFAMHFASNCLMYCSFIAHAHDNIKDEISTDAAIHFLQVLCNVLRATHTHPRVGTLCEDIGLHGQTILARARTYLAAHRKIYLTAVVQDMFSSFTHLQKHRPVPRSLAYPNGLVTTARALVPFYDVHNNQDVSYLHHSPSATPTSTHFLDNLTNAIEVARVKK